MRFGIVFPGGDPESVVDLAVEAEQAGWDGVFLFESHYTVDPWVSLGAIAARTERVRLGTMITPLPFRRPWKVAAHAATLDRVSGGRAILAVGLGGTDTELGEVGEPSHRRERAERLDEGLAILDGVWRGEPFEYEGAHYRVRLPAGPRPVQQPRLPVWVVGAWPRPLSMQRAVRCDGVLPIVLPPGDAFRAAGPDDIRAIAGYARAHRDPASAGFDIVVEGETPLDDAMKARDTVAPLAAAGATWWIEARWGDQPAEFVARLHAGPPRLD